MNKIYLIVLFGIACLFIIITIKKYAPEYAMVASICAGINIITFVVVDFSEIIDFFSSVSNMGGISNRWMKSIMQITSICFLGQWGIQLCRDAGENSIADKMETAIKILVLIICLPYINMLFEMANNLC